MLTRLVTRWNNNEYRFQKSNPTLYVGMKSTQSYGNQPHYFKHISVYQMFKTLSNPYGHTLKPNTHKAPLVSFRWVSYLSNEPMQPEEAALWWEWGGGIPLISMFLFPEKSISLKLSARGEDNCPLVELATLSSSLDFSQCALTFEMYKRIKSVKRMMTKKT